jgi:UMF1 family MFS transporter
MTLLDRLGLGRRDLRAWAMYDWANSAFQTTIIAAVFPIYYQKVAAADLPESVAMSRFAWATTLAILIVAVVAPILGAIADYSPIKKRLLGIFLGSAPRRRRRCSGFSAATGTSRWWCS